MHLLLNHSADSLSSRSLRRISSDLKAPFSSISCALTVRDSFLFQTYFFSIYIDLFVEIKHLSMTDGISGLSSQILVLILPKYSSFLSGWSRGCLETVTLDSCYATILLKMLKLSMKFLELLMTISERGRLCVCLTKKNVCDCKKNRQSERNRKIFDGMRAICHQNAISELKSAIPKIARRRGTVFIS